MKNTKTASRLLALPFVLALVPAYAVPPYKVQRPLPAYPPQARHDHLEGMVVVQVAVKQDGSVSDAKIVTATPPAVFDAAARATVMRWHFQPLCSAHFGQAFSTTASIRFALAKKGVTGFSPVFKVEDESYVGASTGRAIANPGNTASIQLRDPCTGKSLEASSPAPVAPEALRPESASNDPPEPAPPEATAQQPMAQEPDAAVRERPSPAL